MNKNDFNKCQGHIWINKKFRYQLTLATYLAYIIWDPFFDYFSTNINTRYSWSITNEIKPRYKKGISKKDVISAYEFADFLDDYHLEEQDNRLQSSFIRNRFLMLFHSQPYFPNVEGNVVDFSIDIRDKYFPFRINYGDHR
jgi:hypothetical protein